MSYIAGDSFPSKPFQQKQSHHSSSQVAQLLSSLWDEKGCHFLAIQDPKTGFLKQVATDKEGAVRLTAENTANGRNVFHACSNFATAESRKKNNVVSIKSLWLDIDCGPSKAKNGQGYLSQEDAKEALRDFCSRANLPSPSYLINSGNGLHAYWIFDECISPCQWGEAATKLKELTQSLGLKADPSRTADAASLMRTPGSLNLKGETPLPVVFIHEDDSHIPQEKMLSAISAAHAKFCDKGGEPKDAKFKVSEPLSADFEPVNLDRLSSSLVPLDPDCDEETWKLRRMAPLANLAKQFPHMAERLRNLARAWSSGELRGKASQAWTTPGKTTKRTGEEEFELTWQRFLDTDYTGTPVTVATIYHDAKACGWASCEEVGAMTPLQKVQKRYALVKVGARFWVFDRESLAARNADGFARRLEFFAQRDGQLLVLRALTDMHVDEATAERLSRAFFRDRQTFCYEGIDFDPKGCSTSRALNLWIGPTLMPERGDWSQIRAFLFEVICSSDRDAYDYLIRYLAHALQVPEEKPGVMVVLLGGQGTGKGTLGKILRMIWTATYQHIHKIDDVTGNFNASLERAFIIFMDEALFVGDRKSSDALKSLVTESVIQINEKYQPARQTKSYHRFFATTNAEHFNRTERDDRRSFVLSVSEVRKGDHDYWSALNAEIENGGVAAMMHELLAMDLSGFNVRNKPTTRALVEQKIRSLGLIERWWHNALVMGDMGCADGSGWPNFIATKDIIKNAIELSGGRIHRNPSDAESVATMKRLCPSVTSCQRQETLERRRGLSLPDLETARREFEVYIGGAVAWEPVSD